MAELITYSPPTSAARCLFTDEVLNDATKVEHTIPASLGGRIVSTRVSSTTFNEACSTSVDPVLAQAYAPLFNRLGPLVAAHAQPGGVAVQIPDAPDGRYAFEAGGVLQLKNVRIIERHPGGKPKIIEAAHEEGIRAIARTMGVDPARLVFTERLTTNHRMAFAETVPVAREIELGQLKSILLTFDALIGNDPRNFTRDPKLEPVRDMIRRAVVDGVAPSFEQMNRYVLGLQYENVDRIRRFRAASGFNYTPFEHVMVASGKAGTRTLDAAWIAFDSDPIAFRLCDNWIGSDFTCVIVSAVVRDGQTYGPYWYPGEGLLLPYTNLRSHPRLDGTSQEVQGQMQLFVERVAAERRATLQRAIDYVERNCDEFVRENLALLTRLGGGDAVGPCRVADGLALRIDRMFHFRIQDSVDLQRELQVIVAKHIYGLPLDVRTEIIARDDNDAVHVSWPAWIATERAILDEIAPLIGLPGDVITHSIQAVAEIAGQRPVGMPPAPGR